MISTAPAVPAGETAVICVLEFTMKLAALVKPNMTAVAPEKLVPVIVTVVAPSGEPLAGLIALTVGTVGLTYV